MKVMDILRCSGFSVYGEAAEGALLAKRGLRPGQALLLTKALGTGVLLAADARGCAVGRHVAGTPGLSVLARPVDRALVFY